MHQIYSCIARAGKQILNFFSRYETLCLPLRQGVNALYRFEKKKNITGKKRRCEKNSRTSGKLKEKGAGSYFYNLSKGIGFMTSESFHVSSKLKKKYLLLSLIVFVAVVIIVYLFFL